MALIVGFTLVATVSLVLVALFILWLSNKVANVAVTDQFKDAEFILEHHQAPADWAKPRGGLGKIKYRFSKSENRQTTLKTDVLQRLDDLIEFFEDSPFFEDEDTRAILLEELHNMHAEWEEKSLEDIVTPQ